MSKSALFQYTQLLHRGGSRGGGGATGPRPPSHPPTPRPGGGPGGGGGRRGRGPPSPPARTTKRAPFSQKSKKRAPFFAHGAPNWSAAPTPKKSWIRPCPCTLPLLARNPLAVHASVCAFQLAQAPTGHTIILHPQHIPPLDLPLAQLVAPAELVVTEGHQLGDASSASGTGRTCRYRRAPAR